MKRILLFIVVMAAFATSGWTATQSSEPAIRQALASGKPTLIDFGAGFCIPCKAMKPILDSLKKEYNGKANVIFVDIKEEKDMPQKYRIQLIPTQVFFNAKGKEVNRHMGFMDRPAIVSEFKSMGVR